MGCWWLASGIRCLGLCSATSQVPSLSPEETRTHVLGGLCNFQRSGLRALCLCLCWDLSLDLEHLG